MLIEQPKLAKVFQALDALDEVLPVLAVVLPATAEFDGIEAALEPVIRRALGYIFEAATVATLTNDETSARLELAKRIREKTQAALDATFGGGGG